MSGKGAEDLEAAIALAEAATDEARLGALLSSTDPGRGGGIPGFRGAAELIRAAAADPQGFAAAHGAEAQGQLQVDRSALNRLARVFRRDDALSALYQAEQTGAEPDRGALTEPAADLAEAVWAGRESLDGAIGAVATGWSVERMPPLDRNVLRIGLHELRHRPDTPVAVIISEAVRMAKAYSTEHSGRFVNGVLAALAAEERPAT